MPVYTYVCKFCSNEFEEFQSIKDKPLRKCPECKKLSLEKILHAVFGKVSRTRDDMKTVQDLGKFNRDRMTKTEKEKADHDVAESSTLVKHKLKSEKEDKPWYRSKHYDSMKKWSGDEMIKYVKNGTTPSEKEPTKKKLKKEKK